MSRIKNVDLKQESFKAYLNGVEVGDLNILDIYKKDNTMVCDLYLKYYNKDIARSVFTLDAVISCLEPRIEPPSVIFNLDTMNKIMIYSKRVVIFSQLVTILYITAISSFIFMLLSMFFSNTLTQIMSILTIVTTVSYIVSMRMVRKFMNKKL